MSEAQFKQILQAWDDAEEDEPDRSTEYLMEIVSQQCGCDNSDVAEALSRRQDSQLTTPPTEGGAQ